MTTLLILAPVLIPLTAAAIFAVAGWRPATVWVGAVSAAGILAAAIGTAVTVTTGGPLTAVGGSLAVDALSAYMVIVIGAVALVATAATPTHLRAELAAGRTDPKVCTQHSLLVQLFLAAMALAVLAASLGVLWVAIEATTVVTAFLVGQGRGRGAVEAAWKYVIICSTGIALALLGTFLLNYAARQRTHAGRAGLGRPDCGRAHPGSGSDPHRGAAAVPRVRHQGRPRAVARLAAGRAFPGPGTGVRADVRGAHLGRLLRDPAGEDHRRRRPRPGLRPRPADRAVAGLDDSRSVIAVGAEGLQADAGLLQHREHGPARPGRGHRQPTRGRRGAAAHLGHGLAKSVLFLSAGRVLQLTGSSRIDHVRGLAARDPVLAGCLGFGVLAIIAFPPFSLFASELGIATAGFAGGLGWATAAALVLVLVIVAALVGHTSRMLLGTPRTGPGPEYRRRCPECRRRSRRGSGTGSIGHGRSIRLRRSIGHGRGIVAADSTAPPPANRSTQGRLWPWRSHHRSRRARPPSVGGSARTATR